MGIAPATIANAEDYRRALNTSRPVFMLFISHHCPACGSSTPLFERIAHEHPSIVSLVLNCAETPRHPNVTGTPTLLIFLNGTLMETCKGFGPEAEQAQVLTDIFKRYVDRKAATRPASPAAPPPQPPSSASPHAPGYRPPPAGDPADSLPNRPGSGNPQSRQP
ncbi:hypothetical protein BFW86_15950 [Pseudomonas fluorescens]|nr:hypothetical protein BFW86_15950 [Pseudomonas fluorescens]